MFILLEKYKRKACHHLGGNNRSSDCFDLYFNSRDIRMISNNRILRVIHSSTDKMPGYSVDVLYLLKGRTHIILKQYYMNAVQYKYRYNVGRIDFIIWIG